MPLSTRTAPGQPYPSKVSRRHSWVSAAAGTLAQRAVLLEDVGRQDGPETLVADAQPAGPGAVSEPRTLHRVHLPDVVRLAGAAVVVGGGARKGRGRRRRRGGGSAPRPAEQRSKMRWRRAKGVAAGIKRTPGVRVRPGERATNEPSG